MKIINKLLLICAITAALSIMAVSGYASAEEEKPRIKTGTTVGQYENLPYAIQNYDTVILEGEAKGGPSEIDGRDVTLCGSGAADIEISVINGGSLTLSGDLNLRGGIVVYDGTLVVEDGVTIGGQTDAVIIRSHGSLTVRGGFFHSSTGHALLVTDGWVEEISGGRFVTDIQETVLLSGAGVGKITGGRFENRNPYGISPGTFCLDHQSLLGSISGGEFITENGPALTVKRASRIGEISGGHFLTSATAGTYQSYGVMIVTQKEEPPEDVLDPEAWEEAQAGRDTDTGIGEISGGEFISCGDSGCYGLYLCSSDPGTAFVHTISGGLFSGSTSVVLNRQNWDGTGHVNIGEIRGGSFLTLGSAWDEAAFHNSQEQISLQQQPPDESQNLLSGIRDGEGIVYLEGAIRSYGGLIDSISGVRFSHRE
ncbi:MAG: hypothetical protein K6C08_08265 [Oscillospiraceae bacterium]|nr:hypothetical protein [Oscillospiraceae bacterium]